MNVEEVGSDNAGVIWRLLQLYLYELSEHDGRTVREDGKLCYPYFPLYWKESGRAPLLIRADGQLAGFAFIRELETGVWEIAEFFVLRTWRRAGVGKAAARMILQSRPGAWEIRFHAGNKVAAALWKGLAGQCPHARHDIMGTQSVLRFVW